MKRTELKQQDFNGKDSNRKNSTGSPQFGAFYQSHIPVFASEAKQSQRLLIAMLDNLPKLDLYNNLSATCF
jgi:hypothetical protein